MTPPSRQFQVFAKPVGALCNLECRYCYYLGKQDLYPRGESVRMPDDLLEEYIVQHIEASPGRAIPFLWHGGEPTLLGLDYFRRIRVLQKRHLPEGRRIVNGIQTNGTLLDEEWCRFLAAEGFAVGLSLDGPQALHDRYRVSRGEKPTHRTVMRAYRLLRRHGILLDLLCVLHAENARHPARVYEFFKEIKAAYLVFLPLVEPQSASDGGVSDRSVQPDALGAFLCTVFDRWVGRDVGRIRVQNFDEALRSATGRGASLCVFRKTCGDVPVVEHNGDVFACDHFVDPEHRLGNIREAPLIDLLESPALRAFGEAKWDTLPGECRACEVRSMCHGGCPKDRVHETPDGEAGRSYLCRGYRRFFNHVRPYALRTALSRERPTGAARSADAGVTPKPSRNDPCPCGSGRKFKRCCLGRSPGIRRGGPAA